VHDEKPDSPTFGLYIPMGHSAQCVSEAYAPLGHAEQFDARAFPEFGATEPFAHGVHDELPFISMNGWYVFGGQTVHGESPDVQNVPSRHGVQSSSSRDASLSEIRPSLHAVHALSAPFPYVPMGHFRHTASDVAPGSSFVACFPLSHALHALFPGDPLTVL